MPFEYIVIKDNQSIKKTLQKSKEAEIAKKIVADFDDWNKARQNCIDKGQEIINAVFFNKDKIENLPKDEAWKTKINMCKVYMYYCTLKAFIWKSSYANVNGMFDVSGENQEADNLANRQKTNLVNILEKADYCKEFDKIIDYSLFYGELISYVTWRKIQQEYRRPISFFTTLFKDNVVKLPLITAAIARGETHFTDTKTIYDNPYIEAVNPINFAFDTTQDDFNSAGKIYKRFKTTNDILNNKFYQIDETDKQAIKNLTTDNTDKNKTDKDLLDEIENGNSVETLEYWGDYRLSDGTILKNWHIVIVARKYVVYFAKNNKLVNPFTYGAYIKEPTEKRAISPLYSVCPLADLQNELMERTANMQTLAENPPIYAPKGFFKNSEIKLYPSKIIEFGDSLNPSLIKEMQFNAGVFLNDISFLSDLMSEISGIYPNMLGAGESGNKTATEIQTKAQGQSTRLAYLLDVISQYLIIPDVEKVANLLANIKSGIEKVYVNKDNKQQTVEIDDNVRQAEYRYVYRDRSASVEKTQKADLVASSCKEFANFVPMNAKELFKWYMDQKGVENPERFVQDVPEIPQEVQQILLQQPQVQQLIQTYNQQKDITK